MALHNKRVIETNESKQDIHLSEWAINNFLPHQSEAQTLYVRGMYSNPKRISSVAAVAYSNFNVEPQGLGQGGDKRFVAVPVMAFLKPGILRDYDDFGTDFSRYSSPEHVTAVKIKVIP